MALSKSSLSSLIKSKLSAGANVTNDAELQKFCDAIADAVVSHITSAAQVMPTAFISGSPGAPVTGTGTVQ